MPRTAFQLPGTSLTNPHVESARQHMIEWMNGYGLLPSDSRARQLGSEDVALLTGMGYPWASPERMNILTDYLAVTWVIDDGLDTEFGRDPGGVHELVGRLTDVLDFRAVGSAPPVVDAFHDVWRRSVDIMSPTWREHASATWRAYFWGQAWETIDRYRSMDALDMETYIRLWKICSGGALWLEYAELGHEEFPPIWYYSPEVQNLLKSANNMSLAVDDLASLEKEEADGDEHNLVKVLIRAHGLSRDEAIAKAISWGNEQAEMMHRCVARLQEYGKQRDGLSGTDLDRCLTATEAVLSCARGYHDWALISPRYAAGGIEARGENLEDPLLTTPVERPVAGS